MSAPSKEEEEATAMPTGVVKDKEVDENTEPQPRVVENNTTNTNNTTINKDGQVMGDIGNPPRENEHAVEKEDKGTNQQQQKPDKEEKVISPTPVKSNDEAENNMDALKNISPTPTNNNNITNTNNNTNNNINNEEPVIDDGLDDDSSYPSKRTSVFSGREHEETDDFLLSTMLAIRTAVLAGTKDATNVEATPEDFTATRKHKISMAGDRKVEVKDYAPVIFTLIRRKFGISIPAYLLSWSDSRIAKSRSAGKSDSMFIHSPDNKFVLKTLGGDEAKRLRKILQQYYVHITTHKDTFLSRIYGLHRMSRRRGQSNVYFAIFNNVFDAGQPLAEIYDLKGSTVGRKALLGDSTPQRRSSTSFEFKQQGRKTVVEEQPKKPIVLKDLDFTRQLHVGPENKAKVLAQLTTDCKFLSQHLLMDYSLLIGVRRMDLQPATESATSVNDSPKVTHSTATPGSSPDLRVPGLLFFLESTKNASSKSIRETKRDRRKSITPAGGVKSLLSNGEDLSAIDEDEKPDENGEAPKDNSLLKSTPPLSTPLSDGAADSEDTDPTGTSAPTTVPAIEVNEATTIDDNKDNTKDDQDEEDEPAPKIKVNSSPVPQRHHLGGNSGEVGQQPSVFTVPPLKVSSITSPPPNHTNGVNGSTQDSSEDTSESESPRTPLGLMAANSVPNFNYFNNNPSAASTIPRTGSNLRFHSADNTPQTMKRSNRSASLNYVNLDPLCEPPYIPFHKADDGGMKGNTFLALDTKKSNEVYFIGLIDFLQKYNKKKKLAGFAKSFKYEKEELSTVDPVFYMERFLKMAEKAVSE